MRAPYLTLMLGTSIAYAGCTIDVREDMSADAGDAGPTQGTTDPGTSTGEEPASTTTGVSEETGSTTSSTSGDTDDSGPLLDVSPDETGGVEIAEVFGHTGTTLFRLDPETLEVDEVGAFTGCGTQAVVDIALDEESNMFGVRYGALYSIDRHTAECTLIAEGSYPDSLSFVPEGTVDADREALVGFINERYVRIDTVDGSISDIATLADGLRSSGDVVSVKGGGTYLTVFGPGCEDTDCIIEFNPSNGLVLEHYGALPYDQVFGLAFWAGRAYGFSRDGDVFEVEFLADSVTTTEIPVSANVEFFGAGSTTSAPPVAG